MRNCKSHSLSTQTSTTNVRRDTSNLISQHAQQIGAKCGSLWLLLILNKQKPFTQRIISCWIKDSGVEGVHCIREIKYYPIRPGWESSYVPYKKSHRDIKILPSQYTYYLDLEKISPFSCNVTTESPGACHTPSSLPDVIWVCTDEPFQLERRTWSVPWQSSNERHVILRV